jgi:hypothetical protein
MNEIKDSSFKKQQLLLRIKMENKLSVTSDAVVGVQNIKRFQYTSFVRTECSPSLLFPMYLVHLLQNVMYKLNTITLQ